MNNKKTPKKKPHIYAFKNKTELINLIGSTRNRLPV